MPRFSDDLQRRLEEAGLVRDDGEPLGRIPRKHGIWVPNYVMPYPDAAGNIESIGFPPDGELGGQWHLVEEPAGLLNTFVAVANAPVEKVISVAQRYGPLFPCSTHGMFFIGPDSISRSLECEWLHPEPVWLWRRMARRARAALSIAAALWKRARPLIEDWATLAFGGPRAAWPLRPHASEEACEVPTPDLPPDLYAAQLDAQKRALAVMLGEWRNEFHAPPTFEIEPELALSVTAGMGFLPAVWLAVVQAVTRTSGIYTCASCGQIFGRQRAPAVGRAAYCPECSVGQQAAKRDWARRHRQSARERAGDAGEGE